MATVISQFFQNNPRRSNWLVPDTEDGPEAVSDFFKDDLGSMIVENQVIEKAVLQAQENLLSEAKPLLIVTDLEAIHPFTRFGPVEQNIYSDIKIPFIILYPGTISGSVYRTQNNLEITGSINVSGTINPDNVTVGIPTSNQWQSNLNGSYFNNFNSETNVSEILRFVAGLLSASAPDASTNARTYSTYTAAATNTTRAASISIEVTNT
jgi:hypothetical protein